MFQPDLSKTSSDQKLKIQLVKYLAEKMTEMKVIDAKSIFIFTPTSYHVNGCKVFNAESCDKKKKRKV